MLIIRNCNLINMAGIYEEKKDLVVENGKILDTCDNAVSKYNVGHVSIDACGHYVTPGCRTSLSIRSARTGLSF